MILDKENSKKNKNVIDLNLKRKKLYKVSLSSGTLMTASTTVFVGTLVTAGDLICTIIDKYNFNDASVAKAIAELVGITFGAVVLERLLRKLNQRTKEETLDECYEDNEEMLRKQVKTNSTVYYPKR